jgi:cell division protein FtsW (lipid II flippase)
MKKTYWWRIVLFLFSTLTPALLYTTSCGYNFNRCLWGNNLTSSTLFRFSLALIIISLFLFFLSDKIFLKWLKFAVAWIILSIITIVATPERHAFFSMDPDKETVSLWMGILLVIINAVFLAYQKIREGKASK